MKRKKKSVGGGGGGGGWGQGRCERRSEAFVKIQKKNYSDLFTLKVAHVSSRVLLSVVLST